MKILLLLPIIALQNFSYPTKVHFSTISVKYTTGISHLTDGNTGEWPNEKFETNKETGIQYAVDNDKQTIFLALRVPGVNTQKKMMRQGMDLYIDIKGKKKENRGISFPLILENERIPDNQQSNQESPQNNNQSLISFAYMKIFGFSDIAPFAQQLQLDGTANIAFTWDSSHIMHIEYNIPLKMLDESPSLLNQKNISIGWKIKGIDVPTNNNAVRTTTTIVGRPAGSSPPSNRPIGSVNSANSPDQTNLDKEIREQMFWTKFTINL